MEHSTFKIETTIPHSFFKKTLFKGFLIALIGLLGLMIAGIYLPETLLQKWGWIIYFASFFLITIGLLPYRRLTRLQQKPNQIVITPLNYFEFWSKGNSVIAFPLETIKNCTFDQNQGICIHLKNHIDLTKKSFSRLHVTTNKDNANELTFHFFSQRSYRELKEFLDSENEES